jgi:hypothetical protein
MVNVFLIVFGFLEFLLRVLFLLIAGIPLLFFDKYQASLLEPILWQKINGGTK